MATYYHYTDADSLVKIVTDKLLLSFGVVGCCQWVGFLYKKGELCRFGGFCVSFCALCSRILKDSAGFKFWRTIIFTGGDIDQKPLGMVHRGRFGLVWFGLVWFGLPVCSVHKPSQRWQWMKKRSPGSRMPPFLRTVATSSCTRGTSTSLSPATSGSLDEQISSPKRNWGWTMATKKVLKKLPRNRPR